MSSVKNIDSIKKEYSKILKEKRIMVCSGTGCTSSKSLISNFKIIVSELLTIIYLS